MFFFFICSLRLVGVWKESVVIHSSFRVDAYPLSLFFVPAVSSQLSSGHGMKPRRISRSVDRTQMAHSETFPLQVPPQLSSTRNLRGLRPQIDGPRIRKSLTLEANQTLDSFSLWGVLVQTFSRGQLTYATDKLVALLAIASEIKSTPTLTISPACGGNILQTNCSGNVPGRSGSGAAAGPRSTWPRAGHIASVVGCTDRACHVSLLIAVELFWKSSTPRYNSRRQQSLSARSRAVFFG